MKTAVVLASGPSLTQPQIDAALRSGHFTIAVNGTYAKALTASALYAGDFLFWKVYMADIARCFRGGLWTQDHMASERWPKVKRVRATNRDGLGRDCIHLNGNSGFQAINLAFLWGYEKIILLGFDMKLGPAGERHHHADHPHPMVQNQVFFEWLHKSEKLARELRSEGIEVINCTPDSAMHCFPEHDWKETLCARSV